MNQISFPIFQKIHYKKLRNSKLKKIYMYYINEKTHLATEKNFVLYHFLKINQRGVLISSRMVGKKSRK